MCVQRVIAALRTRILVILDPTMENDRRGFPDFNKYEIVKTRDRDTITDDGKNNF